MDDYGTLPPLFRLLLTIYIFMAFCSLFGVAHPRLRRPEGKPIRQAINSWWPPALVGGLVVVGGGWVGVMVFAGLSVWTLYEYLRMLPADARNRTVEMLAYLGAPLHYGLMAVNAAPFGAGLAAWTFGVLPLAWIFTRGYRGVLTGLPRVQYGVVLMVVALSYVPRLFYSGRDSDEGAGLACLLLLAIMVNDAAQYVFGKLFGRYKLAEALSPKKTWEGFAGGLLTTTAVTAAAAPMVTRFDSAHGVVIGASLGIAGLLGDLLVSGMKRDAGVKDTGAVLPQHGGLLDRCDSLLLAAPLYFHGVQAWSP